MVTVIVYADIENEQALNEMLVRSVRSILVQENTDVEVIIVARNIFSLRISIDEFFSPRVSVRYHYHEAVTLGNAWNYGLHVAAGEYILFLKCSDYLMMTDVLSKMIATMENEGADLICATTLFDLENNEIKVYSLNCLTDLCSWVSLRGILFRTSVIREAGGFDPLQNSDKACCKLFLSLLMTGRNVSLMDRTSYMTPFFALSHGGDVNRISPDIVTDIICNLLKDRKQDVTYRDVKVSVIVPVYNAEKYLFNLLVSLLTQSLKELELIFVNDYGDDGSFDYIRQIAQYDERIICLDNDENRGPGFSRNHGLQRAKGEYVAFIDADDYIRKDYLRLLYERGKRGNKKVVKGAVCHLYPFGQIEQSGLNDCIRKELPNVENMLNLFTHQHWSALYSREFIAKTHARYAESYRFGEDIFFLMSLMIHVKKEQFDLEDKAIYYYRRSAESLVASRSIMDYLQHLKKETQAIFSFLFQQDDSDEVAKCLQRYSEERLGYILDTLQRERASENEIIDYLDIVGRNLHAWKQSGKKYCPSRLAAFFDVMFYNSSHFYVLRKVHCNLLTLEHRCLEEEKKNNVRKFSNLSNAIDAVSGKIANIYNEQQQQKKAMVHLGQEDILLRKKIANIYNEQQQQKKAMVHLGQEDILLRKKIANIYNEQLKQHEKNLLLEKNNQMSMREIMVLKEEIQLVLIFNKKYAELISLRNALPSIYIARFLLKIKLFFSFGKRRCIYQKKLLDVQERLNKYRDTLNFFKQQ